MTAHAAVMKAIRAELQRQEAGPAPVPSSSALAQCRESVLPRGLAAGQSVSSFPDGLHVASLSS